MNAKELKTRDFLYYNPIDGDRGMFPVLPEVNIQLLCFPDVEGEVMTMAVHLPPPYRVIQANNQGVVSKVDDGIDVVQSHTVVSELGVQQRTEDTSGGAPPC